LPSFITAPCPTLSRCVAPVPSNSSSRPRERWPWAEAPAPSETLDSVKKNDYSFFIPKLTRDRLDERRQHILRAAEVCFARNGFHQTTIADVRKEAGVSTGAIYTYFPNKESMVRAILERARQDRRRQLAAATSAEAGLVGPALVLLDWANAIFSAQGQHAARVDVNLWAEALRDPDIHRLAVGALREATSAVAKVVAPPLASSGMGSAVDPAAVAQVLIALFLGLEVQTAVGLRLDPAKIVQVLATLFAAYVPALAPPDPRAPPKRPRRRTGKKP
jgi:AcrR family transcriptional regulator